MTVSVCIPTYNQAEYLGKCVESVLLQSHLPDEIIVSDDCSTDNTAEILKKLALENPLIKIIHQQKNLGLTGNSNACLKAANGDLLVRLSSDDILLPHFIEKLSVLMSKYTDAGYGHSATNTINKKDEIVGERKLYRKNVYEDADTALKNALSGFRVSANILMFRKDALEKVGYLNSQYNFAEDYYLSTQLSASGFGNVYCNEILASYRVWEDVHNIRQKRKLEEINGLKAIFNEVLEPAFRLKGWNLEKVNKAKENFAVNQANCLGWTIYSKEEKAILQKALMQLSSGIKPRLFYNLYKSPFKIFLLYYKRCISVLKLSLKKFLLKG